MATRKRDSWREGFQSAVERGELAEAISVLDGEKSSHAGTPRQAVKLEAAKVMGQHYRDSKAALYDAAMVFARSESGGAQEVGLVLLGQLFAHNPGGVTGTICGLADSENWEVREWAASALRRVISENFGAVYPTVRGVGGGQFAECAAGGAGCERVGGGELDGGGVQAVAGGVDAVVGG